MIRSEINTIIAKFKSGQSMASIGSEFGCTGERVRQLLKERGLSGEHGGRSITDKLSRESRAKKRYDRYMNIYGCSYEEYKSADRDRPAGTSHPSVAYTQQKNNAYHRGVVWSLTFWEWWCIWADSGKWHCRGKGSKSYCMCRLGDAGPYSVENVYIATIDHNSTLGRTLAWERGLKNTALRQVVVGVGGRAFAAKELGISRIYLSCLCSKNSIPDSWFSDGKAKKLIRLAKDRPDLEGAMSALAFDQKEAA